MTPEKSGSSRLEAFPERPARGTGRAGFFLPRLFRAPRPDRGPGPSGARPRAGSGQDKQDKPDSRPGDGFTPPIFRLTGPWAPGIHCPRGPSADRSPNPMLDGAKWMSRQPHSPRLLAGMTVLAVLWSLATSERAQPASGAGKEYVVGIEDVLRIAVWGEPHLNLTVRVRPDGRISMPLVNDVVVVGQTPDEIRQVLAKKLSQFIKEPNVTVIVEEINSFRVYVLGEVNRQGALNFYRPIRLLQALAAAGGLTPYAKKEIILVREREAGEQRIPVDYKRLLSGESSQENFFLQPGDTLIVQ